MEPKLLQNQTIYTHTLHRNRNQRESMKKTVGIETIRNIGTVHQRRHF